MEELASLVLAIRPRLSTYVCILIKQHLNQNNSNRFQFQRVSYQQFVDVPRVERDLGRERDLARRAASISGADSRRRVAASDRKLASGRDPNDTYFRHKNYF